MNKQRMTQIENALGIQNRVYDVVDIGGELFVLETRKLQGIHRHEVVLFKPKFKSNGLVHSIYATSKLVPCAPQNGKKCLQVCFEFDDYKESIMTPMLGLMENIAYAYGYTQMVVSMIEPAAAKNRRNYFTSKGFVPVHTKSFLKQNLHVTYFSDDLEGLYAQTVNEQYSQK